MLRLVFEPKKGSAGQVYKGRIKAHMMKILSGASKTVLNLVKALL